MASTDATPVPVKNQAYRVTVPILDADGDLVTGATGLDSEVSKDGAAFADCTNEATEIGSSGLYTLDLTSTEMNADTVVIIVKTTSSGAKTTPIVMYPNEAGDIDVDVTAFGGTAGTFSGGRPEVNTSHAAGTAWNSGAIGAATLAADTITAAKIATDAIGSDELAATGIAEIADAVWDEAMSGHLTVGTYGQWARSHGLTGEVNDAGATTTTFIVDGFTEATADHFNGSVITFTSGACLGQSRVINDYIVTTQQIVLGEALTDAPADNDDFVIQPGSVFIGGTLAQIARLFVTLLNTSGQLQAETIEDATITAAKFAADAITSTVLAASAVDEFWDEAMTEISAPPAVTASYRDALRWMFALSRNKITQTATTQLLRNDADAATIGTSTVSDDGTTAIRGEFA